MVADSTGSNEDTFNGEPPDARPYGTRPYGTRPYGTRPYGTRPYGTRPYGTRPYGTRPYGTRPDEDATNAESGQLDPMEWTVDIAEIICARSALIRLGARLIEGDRRVPSGTAVSDLPDYLQPSESTEFTASELMSRPDLRRVPMTLDLQPRDHVLAWNVAIPNRMALDLADSPELAWAIKQDIAQALVTRADRAFLDGDGEREPRGIRLSSDGYVPDSTPRDILDVVKSMVSDIRGNHASFVNAGWIFDPLVLDELTRVIIEKTQADEPGWGLDATRLLDNDGADGGNLLGYPFVTTEATRDANDGPSRIYFSSNWSEAWIGFDRDLVTVDISADLGFETDETVFRAVMRHDLVVRRPAFFIHAEAPVRDV